ncbi:hypothetical protein WM2015_1204 [Wenzhouxiangella marina]|uniref:Uncharacterized protein n=2 Tax=Wenzhouxiangella marina TaxID=1579979 RepID=A0A0K0XV72_9GAMM|nr:hypothetical protein WM2015_1204 [Wenzhouxiangella marina]
MKLSLSKGIQGWFDVDGKTISIWASSWTGREIVRVDDAAGERVVSDKRSFRFTTPHEFKLGDSEYRIEVNVNFGRAEFRLYKDGVLIDSDCISQQPLRFDPVTGKLDWGHLLKKAVLPILAGLVAGLAFGYLIGSLVKGWGGA